MRREYKQITNLQIENSKLKNIIKTIKTMVHDKPNDMQLGEKIRSYFLNGDNKKAYIYESPDGGETIYRRKFGDYDTPRELVKNEDQMDLFRNK
jgi:hypothetical protein